MSRSYIATFDGAPTRPPFAGGIAHSAMVASLELLVVTSMPVIVSPRARSAFQLVPMSNGCSRRTGQYSPNTISWASAREVRRSHLVLAVVSSASKQTSKMLWLA
jgi:hypothetical protein